jgi:hypothetical protein
LDELFSKISVLNQRSTLRSPADSGIWSTVPYRIALEKPMAWPD